MDPRLVLLADRPDLIGPAASLLAAQWPSSSATSRRSAFAAFLRKARPGELPCHMLLVGADDAVLAHCRLQPACENADGFSAAITSVVVDPSRRGTGLGRALLVHAEEMAAKCGFGYLYLWTHDAQKFYEACGYDACEKVSLLRPALAALGSAAVGKLEALFQKRASSVAAAGSEDGGGADESTVRADSTWYRKRLLELHPASQPLSTDALLASVHDALARGASDDVGSAARWQVRLTHVAWERQIGPCCGLAALRMARSVLHPHLRAVAPGAAAAAGPPAGVSDWGERLGGSIEVRVRANAAAPSDASVLRAAIEKGFSSDGEVFDIHDLAQLAADVCGLASDVVMLGEEAAAAAQARTFARGVGEWLADGGLAIMAYDKDEANHAPALRGGLNAHYLVIVGVAAPSAAQDDEEEPEPPRLVCLHGLSKRPLVLTAEELLASNRQLNEMKGGVNSRKWVLREGGVRLSRRLLLLAPPPSDPQLPVELLGEILVLALGARSRTFGRAYRDAYDASLRTLAFRGTTPHIDAIRRRVAACPALRSLDLSGMQSVDDDSLAWILQTRPALAHVDVSHNESLSERSLQLLKQHEGDFEFVAHGTFWAPSPLLTPVAVVVNQILALRMNSDHGLGLVWAFASPTNREVTGPLDRFKIMITNGYGLMLRSHVAYIKEARAAEERLAIDGEETAEFYVLLRSASEADDEYLHEDTVTRYQWMVRRQPRGEFEGCWMTEAVAPFGEWNAHVDAEDAHFVNEGYLRI